MEKVCPKCGTAKPLTEEFFYLARPTATHKKGGWQSGCRMCWQRTNRLNKQRIHGQSLGS